MGTGPDHDYSPAYDMKRGPGDTVTCAETQPLASFENQTTVRIRELGDGGPRIWRAAGSAEKDAAGEVLCLGHQERRPEGENSRSALRSVSSNVASLVESTKYSHLSDTIDCPCLTPTLMSAL